MNLFLIIVLVGVAGGGGCSGSGDGDSPYAPVFRTRYEPGETEGMPSDAHTQITFQNLATPPPNSLPVPATVTIGVDYEAGTPNDRYARLLADPTAPANGILHFWMRNATIDAGFAGHTKGRIQTALLFPAPAARVTRLYSSQRVYLHPDLALLLSYPTLADWWISLTIQELWLGADWEGHPAPARITLALSPGPGGVFRLVASLDKMPAPAERVWTASSLDYAVPTGEWITLETAYTMGDASTGRFVVRCQAASDANPVVLVDVTDWTYNPDAVLPGGPGPVSLTHWNAQKLYSSDNVLHYIRDQGGVAQMYWDDFSLAVTWPPNWPGP